MSKRALLRKRELPLVARLHNGIYRMHQGTGNLLSDSLYHIEEFVKVLQFQDLVKDMTKSELADRWVTGP